ncbi:ribonuclease H-like domain-containing protein [Patescibacteria group bacterium]|nr:ribonuclease H-like domain-containing protein [Patescibacteria group bacterium]
MSRIPVRSLSKNQLIWMGENKCKHGHLYLSHYNCYINEVRGNLRTCIFDIESGGSLTADWGFMLTYAIKEFNGKTHCDCITPKEIRKQTRDKRLVRECCDRLNEFDIIVVYYGKDAPNRHDLPFLRTRAVKWGIDNFPIYKQIRVIDVYDIIKCKFKFARRSMDNACKLFGIEGVNKPWIPDVWHNAMAGDQKGTDYIMEHNIDDVERLEKLYKAVIRYRETFTTT